MSISGDFSRLAYRCKLQRDLAEIANMCLFGSEKALNLADLSEIHCLYLCDKALFLSFLYRYYQREYSLGV